MLAGEIWVYFIMFVLLSSSEAFAAQQENPNIEQTESSSSLDVLAALDIEELAKVKVITIATGTSRPISEAPAIATVITAQDLDAMGATNLDDAIESIPGMHVARTEINSSIYQVRGLTTKFNSQILVMINGIPITSMFRGDRNGPIGAVPIQMISRIEVIRGPGSALYGADAVAGVINVVTKTADDIQGTKLGARVGSFHTYETWALHGRTYDDLKTSLMVTYRETAGHQREVSEDAQTRLDRLRGTDASLAPGPMNLMEKRVALDLSAEKDKLRLRGSYQGIFDQGTGQGVNEALDSHGRLGHGRATADLTYHDPAIGEHWDLTSVLSFQHANQTIERDLNLFPPGSNLGTGVYPNGVIGNPEYKETRFRFENSAFYTGFQDHRIRLGAGYFLGEIYETRSSRNFDPATFAPQATETDASDTSAVFLPEKNRSNIFGYVQDEWKMSSRWDFTAGVRYDHYSDFGSAVNPRAAIVWKTTEKLTTKFLYGRAFRAPSLVELYTTNNPVTLGNPDLRPEKIDVYELAWAYQVRSDWSTGLNLFYYKATDLIALVRNGNGLTATAQNFGEQTGHGFELETKLKASPNLFLTANYAFVRATDENSKKSAGFYPYHKGYLRGDVDLKKDWLLGTEVIWVGPRDREPNDTRSSLKGYATTNLLARRKISGGKHQISLAIRNLFDADAREPSLGPGPTTTAINIPNDLPLAGRSGSVEWVYRF